MPITRSFRTTIMARATRDPEFRQQMLTMAIDALLAGDLDVGKSALRDYVNATITFDHLSKALNKPSKSLQRMLGPIGNPRAESIFGIIKAIQEYEQVQLHVESKKSAA